MGEIENGSSGQIDVLTNLLALNATAHVSGLKEKVVILSRAGMSPKRIGTLLGTTPHSVSQMLSVAKKSTKKSKR